MEMTVPGLALHRNPTLLNRDLGLLRADPSLHNCLGSLAHDEQNVRKPNDLAQKGLGRLVEFALIVYAVVHANYSIEGEPLEVLLSGPHYQSIHRQERL